MRWLEYCEPYKTVQYNDFREDIYLDNDLNSNKLIPLAG